MVFLVHYSSPINPWLGGPEAGGTLAALGLLGNRGVDLFFALSGYLIHASLLRAPQPIGTYARRRARRLYPAFLAVLALYLLLDVAVLDRVRIPSGALAGGGYLLANLLLLPGVLPITPLIGVAWSLSYEVAFYALLPPLLAIPGLRRWPPRARGGLILAILAAILAIAPATGLGLPRAGLFACGMLLAECGPLLARHGARLGLLALAGLPLCTVLLLDGGADAMDDPLTFAAVFGTAFALCGAAAGGKGLVARALGLRPLRGFGAISYSFYLLHGLVLHAVFAVTVAARLRGDLAWPMLLPAFAASVAAAWCLYALVERRFLDPVRPGAIPAANPPRNPNRLPWPSSP